MNRCEELDKAMPIYYKGKGHPISCVSNLPKRQTYLDRKEGQSGLFAYPRKNNKQKAKK